MFFLGGNDLTANREICPPALEFTGHLWFHWAKSAKGYAMKRVLVTGGAGFIGSHLVEALVKQGVFVRVLDDFSTGKEGNLETVRKDIELLRGNLCDLEVCRQAVAGVDVIFHQGAIPAVPRSVADPLTTHHANITGSLNILTAAREGGVRRVVFAGSSAVYGNDPRLPKTEDMMPDPLSPYALHKLTAEYYHRLFFRLYGLETVTLRYFNVFGPRQDPNSDYAAVIPKFILRMLSGQAPTIFGDGTQTRDFTFVLDVVQGNLLAAKAPHAAGQVMNLAIGERFNLLSLVHSLNKILGTSIDPVFAAAQPGEVKDSQADITLARKLLGFAPGYSFAAGLRLTVDWFKTKAA
jgi:UDP-glucose 4-epimerase